MCGRTPRERAATGQAQAAEGERGASALGGLDGGRDECASGEAERVRGSCCGSGALADRVVLEVMQAVRSGRHVGKSQTGAHWQ